MVAAKKKKKQQSTTRTTRPAKRPHFCKILLKDFARRLKLPPRFVEDHLRGSSEATVVHDVDGGAWDVALERTSDGTFLSGGWTKFVEDHAMRENEFVVFRYDRDMHFTVVMAFDTTACEKDMVSSELCQKSCLCKDMEEEEDVKCSPKTSLKKIAVSPLKKSRDVKHSSGCIPRRHRTRKQTKKDGDSFHFLSTFPYFISPINRSKILPRRALRLPSKFSRAHLSSSKTRMDLRDSDGNVWTVKYIPVEGERGFFSGGWTAFARGNHLQIGDYCAFELVAPAEFKVTIIRADELTTSYRKR